MANSPFKVDHDRYGEVIEVYKMWLGVGGRRFNNPSGAGIDTGSDLIKALENFVYDPLRGVIHAGRGKEIRGILEDLGDAFEKVNNFALKYEGGAWLTKQKAKLDRLIERV